MDYNQIGQLKSLAVRHGVIISKRHLMRLLKMHGLTRKVYADLGEVKDFIIQQLKGPGRLHGYRWMHHKCLSNGICAKKEDVRIILSSLDPDARISHQPNVGCLDVGAQCTFAVEVSPEFCQAVSKNTRALTFFQLSIWEFPFHINVFIHYFRVHKRHHYVGKAVTPTHNNDKDWL